MVHAVSEPTAPFAASDGSFEVHQIPFWRDNFTWLLVCRRTGETAAIDGGVAGPVLEYVERHGLSLTTLLTTHTHPDHVGLHADLQRKGRLAGLRVVGNRDRAADIPGLDEGVGEGDRVRVGEVEGDVLLTEGHLDGHLTYRFGDVLFTGDTLFAGGCGYLFDGPPQAMHASLARLADFDGATRICCAHEYTEDNLRFAWSVEPDNEALAERIRDVWARRARGESTVPTTVALERATNPFLRWDSPTIRRRVAEALPDRRLDSPAAIFAATRALKDRKDYKSAEDPSFPV